MRDPDVLVIRYGELALKGGNRHRYENALSRNLKKALSPLGDVTVRNSHARIMVYPGARSAAMARRAAEVFGVKSVSPAYNVKPDLDAIYELSKELVRDYLERNAQPGNPTFRVRVRRADKRFPITSVDLERKIADEILPSEPRLSVSLKNAELELGVEIRGKENFAFLERIPGPGGLPVGTSGKGLCLLSGGIDSPVAAWLGMKRGLTVGFVSFHSFPYLGDNSKRKVLDLARAVARYQGKAQMFMVPFTEIQENIRDLCPEKYRVVLYRRMMNRISSAIARRAKYRVLLTGESLGQVASQTLQNMELIASAADHLTLRPLITYDKEEAVALARRIGTLELSNRPEPDCCTLFQPSAPVIFGNPEDCHAAEESLPIDGLLKRALNGTELIAVDPQE